MTEFTASNGGTIRVEVGGRVTVTDHTRDRLSAIAETISRTAYLNKAQASALREFFQHERDEELGRWRWSENPDYVVYPAAVKSRVRVLRETGMGDLEWVDRGDERSYEFCHAARAYFEAHPERKPWRDAQQNELWELQISGCHDPEIYRFAQDTTCADSRVYRPVNNPKRVFFHPDSSLIAAGRRIWPEDAS
ncbi:hypothetical protein [Microbacterium maritypicum]|uniref:hypothetical protein n=1 Tax=Microbacterium maritypicum TaxID=33918 RepID=UPI003A928761